MAKVDQKLVNLINGFRMKALREKLKQNQSEFWSRVGVTQSGGSRYESGRDIPQPTKMCISFVFADELKKHARAIR